MVYIIRITKLYRNENNVFVEVISELPGVNVGSISWGDYDNDGDQDLLLSGSKGTTTDIISKVFKNENGKFLNTTINLPGCYLGNASWIDFDNDGNLDILMSGVIDGITSTQFFRNEGAAFKNYFQTQEYDFTIYGGKITALDFDNDGDLDFLLQGSDANGNNLSRIFRNNKSVFSELKIGLPNLNNGSGSAGDFDNDGDTDLHVMGNNNEGKPYSDIYKNNLIYSNSVINDPPSTPQNLISQTITDQSVKLMWDKSTDSTTPSEGLTYNLFVGTSPGNCQIMSPMSDMITGYRKVPKSGNVGNNNFYELKNLKPGKYYWSVQSIDNSFLGGSFAPISSFEISNYNYPLANAGADQAIFEGNIVTLDGSSSFSPNNNKLTYKWICPEGITLSSNSSEKPTFIAPEVIKQTNFTFSLIVNNGFFDSVGDIVVITVRNLPKAPISNAGPDQTVNKGVNVLLDGSASYDPDGNTLTYSWTAPIGINLNSNSVDKPTFIAPVVTQDTPLTFSLIVNDGMMVSSSDIVVITVKSTNQIPIANASNNQTVLEGSSVILDGSQSSDPDKNPLTYNWIAPSGIILSSNLTAKPTFIAPEVEIDSKLTFSLIVNDGVADSPVDQVTITVKNINKPPISNAGVDQSINEGSTVLLDGSLSSDPEGTQLTYHWTAPSAIVLSSATSAKPTFIAPEVTQDTQITLSLMVSDGTTSSTEDGVVITVKNVNKAPIAKAGSDQSVNEGATVTLDGSLSSDPDGNPLIYKWNAPIGITLNSTTTIKPIFSAPEVNANTNYTFSLVVSDGIVDSPADQVIIAIKNVNKAPIANAGIEQTINEGSTSALDGSSSNDPDNDQLDYLWTAPEKVVLSDKKNPRPVFKAPEVKKDSTFIFSLVVNDGFINSEPSTVKVNVLNVIKVGINDISKSQLIVYPNPTKGIIKIEGLSTNQKNEIAILSVEGKLIIKKTTNFATETIDISDLVSGIYLLLINNQTIKIQKK